MTRLISLFLAILLTGLPALPVMAEDSDIVVEVVTFQSVAGTSSERLVAAAAGVRSFMEEQKGYLAGYGAGVKLFRYLSLYPKKRCWGYQQQMYESAGLPGKSRLHNRIELAISQAMGC